jgi:2-dehydropantoate 2-reductase
MRKIRKITVVGMGAVGGVFAAYIAKLASDEIQLSAIARGETLRALNTQGLTWTDAEGVTHSTPIFASDRPSDLGPQDLVIVSVKGPSLSSIAPTIQKLLAPHTIVLVAMNGVPWWFFDGHRGELSGLTLKAVDPDGSIAHHIPVQQVLGCVVHLSAQSPIAGRLEKIKGNHLIIGEPNGSVSDRVNEVADLLNRSGFDVKVSAHIQHDIWFKLWGNMTMNPVSALTRAPCNQILDDPLVKAFCSAVMIEAQSIGNRIGCVIQQAPDDRHSITRSLGSFKTSMLQDVESGKPIELDALVGAVQEIGHHLEIATPNIDALLGLTRLMAQGAGLYSVQDKAT